MRPNPSLAVEKRFLRFWPPITGSTFFYPDSGVLRFTGHLPPDPDRSIHRVHTRIEPAKLA